jgi:Methylase involved in ubiquinone/menaquinone biosynthesis
MGRITRHLLKKEKVIIDKKQVYTSSTAMIEGRRHRVDVSYLLPKDNQEINRLDFQHFGLKLLLGSNYKAPLDPSQIRAILDVGSGTGRWLAEMAQEFPNAHIDGVDIEPPASHIQLPSNCLFTQCDVLKGLPFQDGSFQYVHQRLLVGGVPTYQWPFLTQELIRVLYPGGWLELLESGNIFHNAGPATEQLITWWKEGMSSSDFNFSIIPTLDLLFTKYGLVNHKYTLQIPLGKWAGRAGELMKLDLFEAFKSMKGLYVKRFGVRSDLFDRVVAYLPEEWETNKATYEFYNILGQKRED